MGLPIYPGVCHILDQKLIMIKPIVINNHMNALNCRFIGEFEKGGVIGEGTYGIVFFAKDKHSE